MKANRIKNIIAATILFIFVMSLMSCENDHATIKIMNAIPNVQLKHVSYEDKSVAYSLLPGQTESLYISDRSQYFPKVGVIKFYMVKGDNQVYLETKKEFTIDAGAEVLIRISEDMEVTNGTDWGRETLRLSEVK
jgi:hypothetical protein